jgi:SAM-dependent MidA family methyltransferase
MSDHEQLPDGYLTELHPVACGFMRSLSQMLINGQQQTGSHGVAVLIDYGFPEREYYHPERDQGTLMCHYRHHAHPEPFYLPGLQDVTAHVDFTAMAVAASQQGRRCSFTILRRLSCSEPASRIFCRAPQQKMR